MGSIPRQSHLLSQHIFPGTNFRLGGPGSPNQLLLSFNSVSLWYCTNDRAIFLGQQSSAQVVVVSWNVSYAAVRCINVRMFVLKLTDRVHYNKHWVVGTLDGFEVFETCLANGDCSYYSLTCCMSTMTGLHGWKMNVFLVNCFVNSKWMSSRSYLREPWSSDIFSHC